MDISNGINRPINMYNTQAGNNLNLQIDNTNKIYSPNIFLQEHAIKETKKSLSTKIKKRKINKRLNTIDTDFLPDKTDEIISEDNEIYNFFIEKKHNLYIRKFKNFIENIYKSIPILNCIYLKQKGKKIQKTVETLNDLIQNSDEIISTTVPFGENSQVYGNLAQNLTNAANIIGKANKELTEKSIRYIKF